MDWTYDYTYYATGDGAGDNSGDSWANALTGAGLDALVTNTVSAGTVIFCKDGDFTAFISSTRDGSNLKPNAIIGCKPSTTNEPAVESDFATGTDRPNFTNTLAVDDYWQLRNLKADHSNSTGFEVGSYGLIYNCKKEGGGGTGMYTNGSYSAIISCEVQESTSQGIRAKTGCFIANNYVHDCSGQGLYVYFGSGSSFVDNVITSCGTIGINIDEYCNGGFVKGNTIYNCPVGMQKKANSYGSSFHNNIIQSCSTVGFRVYSAYNGVYNDYNCYFNCVTTTSNATIGQNSIEADPLLTDPDNNDFTLATGSPCLNTALDASNAGAGI